jgi:hypothetical protein
MNLKKIKKERIFYINTLFQFTLYKYQNNLMDCKYNQKNT